MRLAFTHAEMVVAVEIVGAGAENTVNARVLEEIRGYKTAAVVPLSGLRGDAAAAPGEKWVVALHRHRGAAPHGAVLAQLAYTKENIARARAWALPPWRYTPIVAVVQISSETNPDQGPSGGRVVFDVVEVLRGKVSAAKLTDNAWPFAKFRPLVPDGALYLLSAWEVTANKWVNHPMVYVSSLVPVERSALAKLRSEVAGADYEALIAKLAGAPTALATTRAAWSFHQAPHVAVTEVGSAGEEATGCGGHHYTLTPKDWLEGEVDGAKLATHFSPMAMYSFSGAVNVAPYLFYGGGHCYHGNEAHGDRFLAAGWSVGGHPSVIIEASDEERARVQRWLQSDLPRFAARPVEAALFAAERPAPSYAGVSSVAAELEPDLPVEAFARTAEWVRFEVVRRKSVTLADGGEHTWIHCRFSANQSRGPHSSTWRPPKAGKASEWMFEGTDMPDWQPGSAWWGVAVDAKHGGAWGSSPGGGVKLGSAGWEKHKLFIGSSFLPGYDGLELQRALRLSRTALSIRER